MNKHGKSQNDQKYSESGHVVLQSYALHLSKGLYVIMNNDFLIELKLIIQQT